MVNKIKILIITTFVASLFQTNLFGMDDQLTAFVDGALANIKSDLIQHYESITCPIAKYRLFPKRLLKYYPAVYRIDKSFNVNCPYLIPSIQYSLIKKLKELHVSDKNEKTIDDSDIASIANLWNTLISFKEAIIINPKFKRDLKLYSHPDKFLINDNKKKVTTLFTYLTTTQESDLLPLCLEYNLQDLPQSKNSIKILCYQGIDTSSIFHQIFADRRDTVERKYNTLTNPLKKHLEVMQEKYEKKESILDQDIEYTKELWNQLKLSCNYSWLDNLVNPFGKSSKELFKFKTKELNKLVHPDLHPGNSQMNELSACINDTSRPQKSTDDLVCFSTNMIIGQSTSILNGLISRACLNIFTSNNLRRSEKIINVTNKKIGFCKNAIEVTEKRIARKYELAQETLKKLSKQYKPFKTN